MTITNNVVVKDQPEKKVSRSSLAKDLPEKMYPGLPAKDDSSPPPYKYIGTSRNVSQAIGSSVIFLNLNSS